MTASISDTLATNPVLLLFVVVAVGYALGRVRVAGFSLGIAAILFAGIAIGAVDDRFVLPEPLIVLGLAMFVYTIGLTSGPGFLAALRGRGLATNALVAVAIAAASLAAVAGRLVLDLSPARATGAFAGGETNTPALAAVIETLQGKSDFDARAAETIVGYSLCYPLGVVLPLLAVGLVLRDARGRGTDLGVTPPRRPHHPRRAADRQPGRAAGPPPRPGQLRPAAARRAPGGGGGHARAAAGRSRLRRRHERRGRRRRARAGAEGARAHRARPQRARHAADPRELAGGRRPANRRAAPGPALAPSRLGASPRE